MQNYRNGKWANQIISMQHPDGSWGCFHTLRGNRDTPMTTEMALLRLELLGYTAEDTCIKNAIAHMETPYIQANRPKVKKKRVILKPSRISLLQRGSVDFLPSVSLQMRLLANGHR